MATPLPNSFDHVYSTHRRYVWRSLRRLGVNHHLLDDACQDVAAVIFRRLPEFEGRSSLRTWLHGIAKGVAANHRRRVFRKELPLMGMDDTSAGPGSHTPSWELAVEAADAILRFAASLGDEERRLFALGLLEQIPAAEVAGTLGLGVADVRRQVNELRKIFRLFVTDGGSGRSGGLRRATRTLLVSSDPW